jgi:hypothetical protein
MTLIRSSVMLLRSLLAARRRLCGMLRPLSLHSSRRWWPCAATYAQRQSTIASAIRGLRSHADTCCASGARRPPSSSLRSATADVRRCGALAFPTLAGPHAPALDGACPVCDDRVRCPKCGVFHGLDPYTDPRAAACLTGWSAPPVVIGPPAFRDAWLSYRGFLPTVMAPLQHVVLPDGAPTHPDPARAWPPAVPEELQPSAPPGGPVYSPFAAAAQL